MDDDYDFENDYTVSYVFADLQEEETAEEFCRLVGDGDPLTYAEAMASPEAPHWAEAMQEELNAHHTNGTWKVTALPPGK